MSADPLYDGKPCATCWHPWESHRSRFPWACSRCSCERFVLPGIDPIARMIADAGNVANSHRDLTPLERVVVLLRIAASEAVHDDCSLTEWTEIATEVYHRARAEGGK